VPGSDEIKLLARIFAVVGTLLVICLVILFGEAFALLGLLVSAIVATLLLYSQFLNAREKGSIEQTLDSIDDRLEATETRQEGIEEELQQIREEITEQSSEDSDSQQNDTEDFEGEDEVKETEEESEKERLRE